MRSPLLLARLGGAQPDTLREAPGDAARYTTMGAVLIGTAAVAAVSAAFALDTAVKLPAVPALLIGALWGVLILNLDRMLVVSMARRAGFWRNLAAAIPRLALALLIGAVISVPLVLRIFEPEIDNELQVIHSENLIASQKKLDARFADIQAMQARFDELQRVANGQPAVGVADDPDVRKAQEVADAAEKAYNEAFEDARCEATGECGTHKRGEGGAFNRAQAKANEANALLKAAQERLARAQEAAQKRIAASAAAAQEELKTLGPALQKRKDERAAAQRRLDEGEHGNDGLLARLEALNRLSDGRPMMWLAHWALLLLFACVELLPVLAKLLSSAGPPTLYDSLVEQREAGALQADKLWADRQREIVQLRVDARLELERDRAAAQVEAGKKANARLVDKQREIADRAIDVWAEVAKRRTDDELARWYAQHTRATQTWHVPAQPAPPNGQTHVPQPPAPVGP